MEGTIKTIRLDRGFGFIRRSEGAPVFFHLTDLVGLAFDEQRTEMPVRFELRNTTKGARAVNVRPAD